MREAYEDMRARARLRVHQLGIQSIQGTDLVNDAFLRLADRGKRPLNRKDLYVHAARAMRDILVDRARHKSAKKRGGDWTRVDWEKASHVAVENPQELMLLDEALQRYAEIAPEYAQVVELRFFAGFTGDETAKVLGVSPTTVDRRWRHARAWLYRQLSDGGPH